MAAAAPNLHEAVLARILQVSAPERTRSLANGHLDMRHIHFTVHPLLDLGGRGCLKEELQRLLEIVAASSTVSPWLATSTSGQRAT